MMLRTQLMLDEETKKDLERLAMVENISMAKLVRKFIKEGVMKKEKKIKVRKKTLGEFILHLSENAGRSNGKGDLAKRHDYYLYGEGRIK